LIDVSELDRKALLIRKHIIEMLLKAGSGHAGGSLSATELLTTLYFYKLKHDPKNPKWDGRDRFILSKGHAAPLLYSILAEAGYFPIDELDDLRKLGSRLQGHPDMTRLDAIEACTGGSLGHGLSIGVGMALGARLDGKSFRVYVLLGDGEVQEGQIWEAAMAASHYRLDNLTAILDRNGLQMDGATEKIMSIEPLANKWSAFGWNVIEIDGYNIPQIAGALDDAEKTKNKPTVIIAHTTKGKGVPFMEWVSAFHSRIPSKEQVEKLFDEWNVTST
jgi:transketolase